VSLAVHIVAPDHSFFFIYFLVTLPLSSHLYVDFGQFQNFERNIVRTFLSVPQKSDDRSIRIFSGLIGANATCSTHTIDKIEKNQYLSSFGDISEIIFVKLRRYFRQKTNICQASAIFQTKKQIFVKLRRYFRKKKQKGICKASAIFHIFSIY
jgi:hypothetical protein